MKIVIRAGGVGTRLWPMSRKKNPKQFQALVGERSLVRATVSRVESLLRGNGDLFISANREMREKLKKEIPELSDKNIIIEPVGRNTGPAICLESCFLARRFGEGIIVASLPSDDYISDESSFRKMLLAAENFLKKNPDYIVTPGAKPTYPDPGYSYIKTGKSLSAGGKEKFFEVSGWVEKPALYQCKKLIQSGKYFYHTGMYLWKLKTVLDLFRKFQPKMYAVCEKIAAGFDAGYAKLDKVTVELAITAKAKKIAVVVSDFVGWSDLGKWNIIAKMTPRDQNGNVIKGKVIPLDTKDCLIYGPKDKLIAAVGLENMVVVLTEDALLVCPKEKSADVKKIVEKLEEERLTKYL